MDVNPYRSPRSAGESKQPPSKTYYPAEAKFAIALTLALCGGLIVSLLVALFR